MDKDPCISEDASKTFKSEGKVDIIQWNGKFQTVSFEQSQNPFKMLRDIELSGNSFWKFNYTGMVNKDDLPDGFGRAITTDKDRFMDG